MVAPEPQARPPDESRTNKADESPPGHEKALQASSPHGLEQEDRSPGSAAARASPDSRLRLDEPKAAPSTTGLFEGLRKRGELRIGTTTTDEVRCHLGDTGKDLLREAALLRSMPEYQALDRERRASIMLAATEISGIDDPTRTRLALELAASPDADSVRAFKAALAASRTSQASALAMPPRVLGNEQGFSPDTDLLARLHGRDTSLSFLGKAAKLFAPIAEVAAEADRKQAEKDAERRHLRQLMQQLQAASQKNVLEGIRELVAELKTSGVIGVAARPATASTLPSIPEPSPPSHSQAEDSHLLTGWKAILAAMGMDNTRANQVQVKRLTAKHDGPIKWSTRPVRVSKGKLWAWLERVEKATELTEDSAPRSDVDAELNNSHEMRNRGFQPKRRPNNQGSLPTKVDPIR